jgi:hypothetical protein
MRALTVRSWSSRGCRCLTAFLLVSVLGASGLDDEGPWIDLLVKDQGLAAWKPPQGEWTMGGGAAIAPDQPRRLVTEPGDGVLVNGPTGKTNNLLSRQSFGDLEFHCEFLVPSKSNSGVKFEGLYEVQIADSWGVEKPKASDCGGIYPRAELKPNYHYLDQGYPPRTNASRRPGEWQTLDVIFQPPRFDAEGKKVANARFVKVVLNGEVVHENLELASPTGHAWHEKEIPAGPILLQGDHGPVAFRNIRVRPLGKP